MHEASEREDFETALILRDRIRALTNVQKGNLVEYADIGSADFVALSRKNGLICLQVFFIRGGQNCGNVPFFPRQTEDASDSEILEAFLGSFYSTHIPADEIVVSHELENHDFMESALGTRIMTYAKGNKAKIIQMVIENAMASLERKVAMEMSVMNNLKEFQAVFGLKRIPRRI